MSPLLTRWRKQRGERLDAGSTVIERNAPLLYEPGTSWSYGTALDWVGKLVERIINQDLESYMKEKIWDPLGITDITFRPQSRPDLQKRFAHMSIRRVDGVIVRGGYVHRAARWEDCFGGHGACGTVSDYFKILRSLLVDDEILLKKETARMMFEPQLTEASRKAMDKIFSSPELSGLFIGDFPKPHDLDWGIGGLLATSDEESGRKQGTLMWSGMPNLFWVSATAYLFVFGLIEDSLWIVKPVCVASTVTSSCLLATSRRRRSSQRLRNMCIGCLLQRGRNSSSIIGAITHQMRQLRRYTTNHDCKCPSLPDYSCLCF